MNDTRKRLIAALQELLDKCTSKLPYASEKEEDYLRGRYSAIIDMADKIKEICTDKPQDYDKQERRTGIPVHNGT